MHRFIRTIVSAVWLLVALGGAVSLASVEAPETDIPANETAMGQLMRMAHFLSQLEQFSVKQQSGYDVVQDSGQKIEFEESRELVVVRPDRFRVDVQGSDGEESTVTFDGKTVTAFNATKNMYAASEIPGSIDEAIKHFVQDLQMRLPLAMLFVTTLPEEIEQRVQEAAIVETATIEGAAFTHLAARSDRVDFQVWLPETGDPLPRRIVITYKHEDGQPQYWADFSDWNLSPNPPDSSFSLDIGKGTRRIAFLAETARASSPPSAEGEDK